MTCNRHPDPAIGDKFGDYTTVDGLPRRDRHGLLQFLMRCACGREKLVVKSNLFSGGVKCCGQCQAQRQAALRRGSGRTPEEADVAMTLYAARHRCSDPRDKGYPNYGGRGIEFRFSSIEEGIAWVMAELGPRPHTKPVTTLDRIDNNGHYEPGNLRWTDTFTQARNRRARKRK